MMNLFLMHLGSWVSLCIGSCMEASWLPAVLGQPWLGSALPRVSLVPLWLCLCFHGGSSLRASKHWPVSAFQDSELDWLTSYWPKWATLSSPGLGNYTLSTKREGYRWRIKTISVIDADGKWERTPPLMLALEGQLGAPRFSIQLGISYQKR